MSEWETIAGLGPGIWAIDKWHPSGWHWRSVAVSLTDGALVIYSPLKHLGDEAHQSLAKLGRPELLLAPNGFHHLGLAETLERYGQPCRAVAPEVAATRGTAKSGCDLAPISVLVDRLPGHVALLTPPGLKTGEVWLRVRAENTVGWVVGDAFFSLDKTPSGFMGWFLRLTGTSPGLRIGRTFTTLAVGKKAVYRDWLLE
ncbi:MAG: hypothetical protein GY778_08765, partial [bacterium]|nr:hypothetical protein [bacterium]